MHWVYLQAAAALFFLWISVHCLVFWRETHRRWPNAFWAVWFGILFLSHFGMTIASAYRLGAGQ